MAKKNVDRVDSGAKPRAPRRATKRADAPAADLGASSVTNPGQRAEASDMTATSPISDTPAEVTLDPPAITSDPSYDDIARNAYQRYLSRGGDHGRDFDDWLEAERELRSRRS